VEKGDFVLEKMKKERLQRIASHSLTAVEAQPNVAYEYVA
jgi:hypothetical protein